MTTIDKNTQLEALINLIPESFRYLMEKGIRCLTCGESMWGTLEEAAKEKGFSEIEIQKLVEDLMILQKKLNLNR